MGKSAPAWIDSGRPPAETGIDLGEPDPAVLRHEQLNRDDAGPRLEQLDHPLGLGHDFRVLDDPALADLAGADLDPPAGNDAPDVHVEVHIDIARVLDTLDELLAHGVGNSSAKNRSSLRSRTTALSRPA